MPRTLSQRGASAGGARRQGQIVVSSLIMKHQDAKQKSLRLGPRQLVIELADRFQLRPQLLIIPHPLLDLLPLLGSNTELAGSTSRIAHRQNPNSVASPRRHLRQPRRWKTLRSSREPRTISAGSISSGTSCWRALRSSARFISTNETQPQPTVKTFLHPNCPQN